MKGIKVPTSDPGGRVERWGRGSVRMSPSTTSAYPVPGSLFGWKVFDLRWSPSPYHECLKFFCKGSSTTLTPRPTFVMRFRRFFRNTWRSYRSYKLLSWTLLFSPVSCRNSESPSRFGSWLFYVWSHAHCNISFFLRVCGLDQMVIIFRNIIVFIMVINKWY